MRAKGQKYGGNSGTSPPPPFLPTTLHTTMGQSTIHIVPCFWVQRGKGGEFSYSVGRHLPRGSAAGLRERAHSGRLDVQYELPLTWREFRRHSLPTGERKKLFLELAPYNSGSVPPPNCRLGDLACFSLGASFSPIPARDKGKVSRKTIVLKLPWQIPLLRACFSLVGDRGEKPLLGLASRKNVYISRVGKKHQTCYFPAQRCRKRIAIRHRKGGENSRFFWQILCKNSEPRKKAT